MNIRKFRFNKYIAVILTVMLAWEGMQPIAVYASYDSAEILTESYADQADETGLAGNTGDVSELIDEGSVIDAEPVDELSEEALSDDSDDGSALMEQLSEDEPFVMQDVPKDSEEAASVEEMSDGAGAQSDTADMTVMLYAVGSDLEGNSMSATVDILEIMEGMYISNVQEPNVNFIVETGGVKINKPDRARNDVINDREQFIKEDYDQVAAGKGDRYLEKYKYITKGESDWKGIDWGKNERYEIYANELLKAKTQPTNPQRYMTRSYGGDIIQELAEFIKTTKADYPAKQYMLILWDHGGGPLGGLGKDERDDPRDERDAAVTTFQAWNIAPTLEAAGVENDQFAMVNYDACLMGSFENVLAWSPYTRYYCGSEDLEANNGDFYENWVSMLCKESNKNTADFTNESYVDSLMEKMGKQIVEDYYAWYNRRGDIGTKSLVKTSEAENLGNALSRYAKAGMDLYDADPIETYYGIYALRADSQDFSGREAGIMDISDFVLNMNEHFDKIIFQDVAGTVSMRNAVAELKNAGNNLIDCEKKAVLLHKETSRYDIARMGGLTVYLPYLFPGDRVTEYMNKYRAIEPAGVIDDYRSFVGTFCAIQSAGELLVNADKGKNDVAGQLKTQLDKYGIGSLYSGRLKKIPAEITDHRLQNEGMKIFKENGKTYYKRRDFKLVYDVCQSPEVSDGENPDVSHLLGYLPAGEIEEKDGVSIQELTNYSEQKWFGFKVGEKYIPASIWYIDSGYTDAEKKNPGDPFIARTDAKIPVMYNGRLHFLDVEFEKNSNNGKIHGMWPFDYENRSYSRYMKIDDILKTKNDGFEIKILADVANALEGEKDVEFNHTNPGGSILGNVMITNDNKNSILRRGIQLCGQGNGNIADGRKMEMRYFMQDLFGSLYPFDELKENVNLSAMANTRKAKGSVLKADDIKFGFKGQSGTEYEDSELKDVGYYLDEECKKELEEIDGKFYTKEPLSSIPAEGITDMSDYIMPEGAVAFCYKEFHLEKDTKIYVRTDGELSKLDGATEDLDKYFTLSSNSLEVTFKVSNTPGEGNGRFANKSKPDAKQAMISDIEPVTYTGKNLVTTQSTSSGSKVIDLILYDEDGESRLREGIDYNVSYRNNKNAGTFDQQKNPPTLTITGKGDYAGMKYVTTFTIKKAEMTDVTLTFNKKFAPLTKKGISLSAVVTMPSGVKIPASQYKLHYYGLDGEEISIDKLAQAYTSGKEMIPLIVKAEALAKAKNFVTGSKTDYYPKADEIYAYPKTKGSLSVSLSSNKVSLNDKVSGYDMLNNMFKKATLGSRKLSLDELQYHGVYYDSKFTLPLEDDMLTTAGTCYIAVSLTPEKQKEYGNYSVRSIRINVTGGVKLKKGNVTLDKTTYTIKLGKLGVEPVPVTLKFADNFNWDKLTIICTTRTGGTTTKTISVSELKDKKIILNDIDNSAPGSYSVQIKGSGNITGSLKLNYKITR